MARIYLAAAWSRKDEMNVIANRLEALGHTITSRWLTNENDSSTTGTLKPLDASVNAAQQFDDAREHQHSINAMHDVEDVIDADYLIRFSDADEMAFPLVASKLCSGARHFEMGLAYALDLAAKVLNDRPELGFTELAMRRLLFVVGGKQNIFDRLPEVMHVEDTEELIRIMERAAELEGVLPVQDYSRCSFGCNDYDFEDSFRYYWLDDCAFIKEDE
jgi:hypothetical protein